MLAHVNMYANRIGSFCTPANEIIHRLLLTPASGSLLDTSNDS
ncbi:hypothetical protein SLEP1_g3697 [Rubroshorea leprosula]|uniref:Uncharacterized protein n=1 Tax=Rubroshorea leprosula TaxID=152421 RepID=A0AAV5HLB5_9ROSI|nr:hypothetical protein SLEP1_g3697 [Rubroshorea leprosula]